MTRNNLARRDIVLLGRLAHGPCELGALPVDGIERLTALGLATRVLGCCEITRAGQLTYHRHHYSRGSRERFAHVARIDFHLNKKSGFPASSAHKQPFTVLDTRYRKYPKLAMDLSLPDWLRRFVTETAHRVGGKGG